MRSANTEAPSGLKRLARVSDLSHFNGLFYKKLPANFFVPLDSDSDCIEKVGIISLAHQFLDDLLVNLEA